ncbi:MAG: hypothetical protein LC130_16390 [Bryobacterales bacterium]|nr:hypothetical protein [Bryobacterales bacterium]
MSTRERRYYTEDEIWFLSDLFDRERFDVLMKYTDIILRDERSWDENVNVVRVKAHAAKLRAAARAMTNGAVA